MEIVSRSSPARRQFSVTTGRSFFVFSPVPPSLWPAFRTHETIVSSTSPVKRVDAETLEIETDSATTTRYRWVHCLVLPYLSDKAAALFPGRSPDAFHNVRNDKGLLLPTLDLHVLVEMSINGDSKASVADWWVSRENKSTKQGQKESQKVHYVVMMSTAGATNETKNDAPCSKHSFPR